MSESAQTEVAATQQPSAADAGEVLQTEVEPSESISTGDGAGDIALAGDVQGEAAGNGESQEWDPTPAELQQMLLTRAMFTPQQQGTQQAATPAEPPATKQDAAVNALAQGDVEEASRLLQELDESDPTRRVLDVALRRQQATEQRLARAESFIKQMEQERNQLLQETQSKRIEQGWIMYADRLRKSGFEHALGKTGQALTTEGKRQLLAFANTVDAIRERQPSMSEEKAWEIAKRILPKAPPKSSLPPQVRGSTQNKRAVSARLPDNATDAQRIATLAKLLGQG